MGERRAGNPTRPSTVSESGSIFDYFSSGLSGGTGAGLSDLLPTLDLSLPLCQNGSAPHSGLFTLGQFYVFIFYFSMANAKNCRRQVSPLVKCDGKLDAIANSVAASFKTKWCFQEGTRQFVSTEFH